MRRLWAGLRSGDAPGMTCHPTDPDNPPADDGSQAPEGTQTKECYGALLLIAREMKLAEGLCKTLGDGAVREYRKLRPKGLTRAGLASWVWRFAAGGTPITGPTLPTTFMHDDEIQHPDFEAPDEPE